MGMMYCTHVSGVYVHVYSMSCVEKTEVDIDQIDLYTLSSVYQAQATMHNAVHHVEMYRCSSVIVTMQRQWCHIQGVSSLNTTVMHDSPCYTVNYQSYNSV